VIRYAPRQNERPAAYPNVGSNRDWLTEFISPAKLGIEGMHWSEKFNPRPEQRKSSDVYATDVQHDAVEEHPFTNSMFEP